jgi:putative peptide zinc metalloprotease protein
MIRDTQTALPGRREDLLQIVDRHSPRRWTILDALTGRITRINTADWNAMGRREAALNVPIDRDLYAQAIASGLLRSRSSEIRSSWYSPLHLLAIRVPLFNADSVAAALARRTEFLFSPLAITAWLALITLAVLSLFVGWSNVQQASIAVYAASNSTTALGYTLGGLFLITKAIHELGHAVACRRLGASVGDFGLFFFCGMPCPYVDVSRIWQLDSKFSRAAVMMAGVYVELIVASLATLVWWSTSSGTVHLLATNLILVCGISTLVFNANPLMRMDGYFVLSDLLETPNLRRQAALAWRAMVAERVLGLSSRMAHFSVLAAFLSLYHALSSLYRWMVAAFILVFIFSIFREWNLWWLGVAMIGLAVLPVLYHHLKGYISMLRGKGIGTGSPLWRRFGIGLTTIFLVVGGLMCPVRREITTNGFVDVADAVDVYVPESGWVDSVAYDFGEPVQANAILATLRDETLAVQLVGMRARNRLASLESEYLKRKSLQSASTDVAWQVDHAQRELVESQYRSLVSKEQRLRLVAPQAGVLLPPLNRRQEPGLTNHFGGQSSSHAISKLQEREGTFVESRTSWCRIGTPAKRCATLPISSVDRQHVRVGQKATLVIDDGMTMRVDAMVDSVDEIAGHELAMGKHCFLVRCMLPADHANAEELSLLGASAEARIEFDREPVWRWIERTVTQSILQPYNSW